MIRTSTDLFIRDRFTWLAYFMLAYYAYMQAALGPLMPFLRAELELSYTVGGLHFSAFALGMVLAGLSGDRLADRWGRRFIFWIGGIGMAGGALSLAFSTQVSLTIASSFIMGYLGTLLLVMIQATLSDRHGEQRAIALTESNIGASLFAMFAPVFIGLFQRLGLGWRSGLFLAVIVFGLIALRFFKVTIPRSQPSTAPTNQANRALPISFWAYWLVIYLGVSIEWCLISWGAEFLEKVVGLVKADAATTMGVFFLAMVLGRFAGSRLTKVMSSANLLLGAIGIVLVGFPLFWLAQLTPLNIIGLFITGLGVANLFPLTLSVAVSVVPQRANRASARTSLGGGLAILISPFLLGWTADQLNLQNAYGIVALLAVLALVMTVSANRLAQP